MDVNALQSKLENQPDKIIQILEALGFENIRFNPQKQSEICSRRTKKPDQLSGGLCNVTILCLFYESKGNIFSLIMDVKRCSFPDALKFAAIKAGLSLEELNIKTRWPFGGFFFKTVAELRRRNGRIGNISRRDFGTVCK